MDGMKWAFEQAKLAFEQGEVPVGAVILSPDGALLAKAHNEMVQRKDPTAHAEILAIRQACEKLGTERLIDCDLYVTLEPCAMCAGAISFARIKRLYFGAFDEKSGGVEHGGCFYAQKTCHHAPEVYSGFMEKECQRILQDFFKMKRR